MSTNHEKIAEILSNIVKVADTPKNEVNVLPEMTLEYIAREAKEALRIMSASGASS